MEKKTINEKTRTTLFVIFATAMVLSTTSLVMQSTIQFANADNFFEDDETGDIYYCDDEYDTAYITDDDDVICLD